MLTLPHFFRRNLICYLLILFFFIVTATGIQSDSGQPTTAHNATLREHFEINNSSENFSVLGKFDVVVEVLANTTIDSSGTVVASLGNITESGNYGNHTELLRRSKFLEKNTSKLDAAEEEDIPELDEEWECGTDEFSKLISENTIDRDCPLIKNEVNKCCIAHDSCYDNQLGQKRCDDNFCDCLDIVTAKHPVCNKEDGPTFCLLVREFGAEPYLQSSPAAKAKLAKEQSHQEHLTSKRPNLP